MTSDNITWRHVCRLVAVFNIVVPLQSFSSSAAEQLAGVANIDIRDLVEFTIGMAVREGIKNPDISIPKAFEQVLRDAESFGYSASASFIGLIPSEHQKVTIISTGAVNPAGAQRLIEFLSSEEGADSIAATGLVPVVAGI